MSIFLLCLAALPALALKSGCPAEYSAEQLLHRVELLPHQHDLHDLLVAAGKQRA